MTNIQKSVPVLRFKDELGNCYPLWGEKKFSFIAKKVNDSYKPTNNGESFECIELESLSSETGLLIRTFRSSEQKSMKTKFLTGDVLFGKLRPYLKKFYRSDFDGVCTSEIWVLRPKSVPSEFLFYVVQSGHFNRLANIQSGTKMPRSNWGIVSQSNFKIPSDYGEQQKIASFLSSVDTKIEQLSEKKALLEQYKKGMMQKLFSQEIRFKDEQGNDYPDWEEMRFDEIANITMGTSPKSSAYNHSMNGLPLIQGNADVKNRKSAPRIYTSEITKECLPNDTLLSVRAPVGEVSRAIHHACIGRGISAVRVKAISVQDYIFHYLVWSEPKWKGLSQGSTFESVNTKSIESLKILVPSKLEQQKIADFLSAIDKKIDLVAEQLEQARTFKKGLLQQMFI